MDDPDQKLISLELWSIKGTDEYWPRVYRDHYVVLYIWKMILPTDIHA